MKIDLIFEGGGVLGLSFIGAYKSLFNQGFDIERCGGTSAGSIIASLIMAGYLPDELETIIMNTDFNKFTKKTKTGKLPLLGRWISLFTNNGLYDSRYLEEWLNDLLKVKGIESFGDVYRNGNTKLKIIASDVTKRKMLVLPDDLVDYGINPKTFSIAKAVRMSCNIPLYFTPVKLEYEKGSSLIVDGGLLSSYPIWLFDEDSKWPTIGLKIRDVMSNSYNGKDGFYSYIKDLIDTTTNRDETNFIKNEDLVRTIIIDYNEKIDTKDFTLSNTQIKELYTNGFNCTENYLNHETFLKDLKINWSKIVREQLSRKN
ncbi:patatin-like phospholipase family protein [Haloplasma contractile]|uniref:PNPLA domain-containing protein n=1 Tax=Haloplasma contractile SSD-17B TaxID=1033810 RepID=U2FMY1_9MOLU|nr:patatin-like phospholipase family protein [Haloplasma contractile]ERJ12499.1 Phospholipase putative protein [Haloplasma contractile SSD-17B]